MNRPIAIDLRARQAYPFMRGIVLAMAGTIVEDEASGIRVQVREDGGLEEINALPARRSIAADPTATRGRP